VKQPPRPSLDRICATNASIYKSIRLAALQDTPIAFGSTYANESQFSDADWLKRAAKLNGDKSVGYLAMDGAAACGIVAAYEDEHDPHTVNVVSMWVAPTHRRSGIGRALIGAIDGWARDRGASKLQLMVTSSNKTAMEFYKRLGFSPTGRTEPYPNDPALVEHEMSRAVGP
jgi:ribosomal protein S18 acetylase RimI-like enzyme